MMPSAFDRVTAPDREKSLRGSPEAFRRTRSLYLTLVATSLLLGLFVARLPAGHEMSAYGDLIRFVGYAAVFAAVAATWAVAVAMASVHEVVWPLITSLIGVLLTVSVVAVRWWRAS